MTQELVKELRSLDFDCRPPPSCIEEAADTIERLQRELVVAQEESEILAANGDKFLKEKRAVERDLAARDKTIETLREDAERWRFGLKHGFPLFRAPLVKIFEPHWIAYRGIVGFKGSTANEAIDAARSEEKP